MKKQHEVFQRRYGCRRESDDSYKELPIKVQVSCSLGRTKERQRDKSLQIERNSENEVRATYSSSAQKQAALVGHAKKKIKKQAEERQKLKKDILINSLRLERDKKERALKSVYDKKKVLTAESMKKDITIKKNLRARENEKE